MVGNLQLIIIQRHLSCTIDFEFERQRLVEKELGCEFTRFNPDNPDFDIVRVIDKLHYHRKRNMIDKFNKLVEDTE